MMMWTAKQSSSIPKTNQIFIPSPFYAYMPIDFRVQLFNVCLTVCLKTVEALLLLDAYFVEKSVYAGLQGNTSGGLWQILVTLA